MPRSNITPRLNSLIAFLVLCVLIGAGCTPTSTPSQATATQATIAQPTSEPTINIPTQTPTELKPTQTEQPTETPLPPTAAPETENLEIVVPPGTEATIDGVLSAEEWEDALQIDLDDENQLLLMHASGYLYIGRRGKPEPAHQHLRRSRRSSINTAFICRAWNGCLPARRWGMGAGERF